MLPKQHSSRLSICVSLDIGRVSVGVSICLYLHLYLKGQSKIWQGVLNGHRTKKKHLRQHMHIVEVEKDALCLTQAGFNRSSPVLSSQLTQWSDTLGKSVIHEKVTKLELPE
ncbi:unnamed protein product [Thelazia callipaeda]|uniref:Transposase n=1 Tax=Thelazia callipaeda TaxID=103827 RepID=A0A0N5DBQ0_THECL|nr:unnamed protein product [Thelazia callipaeda]